MSSCEDEGALVSGTAPNPLVIVPLTPIRLPLTAHSNNLLLAIDAILQAVGVIARKTSAPLLFQVQTKSIPKIPDSLR